MSTKNDCTLLHFQVDTYTDTQPYTHTYAHTNTSPHDVFSKENSCIDVRANEK